MSDPGWRGNLMKLAPSCDLVHEALEAACSLYRERSDGAEPSTLLVGTNDLEAAYRLNATAGLPRLVIVCVPHMPRWSWMVVGPNGVVYSEGA